MGGKLGRLLNQWGLIVGGDCATANVHDRFFPPLGRRRAGHHGGPRGRGRARGPGDPPNRKVCARGEWNDRMVVETVLSMLTLVGHFKKVLHRAGDSFRTRLACTMAAFTLLVQWRGLPPDANGFIHLSIAEFSL